MKALVYTGTEQMEFRNEADPAAREGEVVVRIASSGICGSDMHAFLGHDERRPAPLILGHEAAGTISSGPRSGERVVINPLVTCGTCEACAAGRNNLCPTRQIISMPPRPGAFAEYVAIPEKNLISVPDGVSHDKAALAEPIACGWHAVRLAQGVLHMGLQEARCLVIGGGAIGTGAALVLAAHKAGHITVLEPNDARREVVESMGSFHVAASDDGLGNGFDLVIDAVGYAATRATASAAVKPGGVIMHIGLGASEGGLDVRRMTLQEITFIGTYTYTPADFAETARAIFDGRLGALDWMDVRPLAEGFGAFRDIRSGKVAAPKIILKP
jgi:threonine dehydrogenase-like Zn-dependent dehydrogenase